MDQGYIISISRVETGKVKAESSYYVSDIELKALFLIHHDSEGYCGFGLLSRIYIGRELDRRKYLLVQFGICHYLVAQQNQPTPFSLYR